MTPKQLHVLILKIGQITTLQINEFMYKHYNNLLPSIFSNYFIFRLYRDVLHWLPVPLRVEFKICLLVYKSLHGAAPGYLREYCKETHSSASGLRLRST